MSVNRITALLLCFSLAAAAPARTGATDAQRLDSLAQRYWQRELANSYALQMELGIPVRALRAPTEAAALQDAAFGSGVLRDLAAVNASRLDHDRWLTYRELQYDALGLVGDGNYFWYQQQITPYQSQYAYMLPVFTAFRFRTAADGVPYVVLLRDLAAWTRALEQTVRGQHARRIILPDVETDAAVATLRAYAAPASQSPYAVPASRLRRLAPDAARATAAAIRSELRSDVVPAFASLLTYLQGAYRAGAPNGVGQSQYPGGRAFYDYMVRRNTTLDLTPAQIQAMGLREVARINGQLDLVRQQMGFKGSLAAFHTYLKSDPRFFATSGPEIGDRLRSFVARVAGRVPSYYERLPAAPYGVEPLPANLAGAQTFGYYDPPTAARPRGIYRYNGSDPKHTWLPQAGSLIMHELIPGHHFQIALQQENTALAPVRRYDFTVTSYVEGYAEYASQLGFDMHLYDDPYYRVGRLMQDMMVSCRLVVDPGMNELGWSWHRAQQFMRDNTILSDAQIRTETLRYSLDLPAQALGYKLGELQMLALRAQARQRLGSRFDIRAFHRWLIGSGTMTLATLRAHMAYEERLAAAH